MLLITVEYKKKKIAKITFNGHCPDSDVCAAATSIMITSASFLVTFKKKFLFDDKIGFAEIKNISFDEFTNKVFNNMLNMLYSLQENHPNNLKISTKQLI